MEERYNAILSRVKYTKVGNRFNERIEEILPLIENGSLDIETKNKLLVQLYRFLMYSEVPISIDPRGDISLKSSVLSDMKKGLQSGMIDDSVLERITDIINLMRDDIDDPFKVIDESIAFYKENPGARF